MYSNKFFEGKEGKGRRDTFSFQIFSMFSLCLQIIKEFPLFISILFISLPSTFAILINKTLFLPFHPLPLPPFLQFKHSISIIQKQSLIKRVSPSKTTKSQILKQRYFKFTPISKASFIYILTHQHIEAILFV